MQCGNCGKEIPLPGGKCPHCGASGAQQEYFHAPVRTAPSPITKPSSPPKKPRPNTKSRSAPQKAEPTKKSASPKRTKPPVPQREYKPKKRRRSKILLILMLFWCIVAVILFSSYFSFYSDTDRYLQIGEEFVQALVLQDDTTLSNYIHKSMRGNLYPLEHGTVRSCQVQGSVAEETDVAALTQELRDRYGLKDTIATARWVLVKYTIEQEGQVTSHSIEVLLANIGGDIYAVKTRNMENPTPFSQPSSS